LGFKRSPSAAPHTAGRHEYNGVLPGAPRGSFTTLDKFHPSATQPSAPCLTPWLRCFGPVENKILTSLQDVKCTFGGEVGIPDDQWEGGTSQPCGYDQRKPHERILTFPPLSMGWLNRFSVLSSKACGTLTVLEGDNSSSRSYPHTSALPHSSRADRSDTQESLCRRVGGSGHKTPLPLREFSRQSRLVVLIETPRLMLPSGTTRRCCP
jgi:hypothetical protein